MLAKVIGRREKKQHKKFNPPCGSCKANNSSWDPNDPFLSFPSLSQPISLVSHWILPYQQKELQNPRSIISLLSHCVKYPNPGDTFISIEEALELMRSSLRLQLFWLSCQIICKLNDLLMYRFLNKFSPVGRKIKKKIYIYI